MMGDILGEDIDVQCEMAPEGYEVSCVAAVQAVFGSG